MEKIHQKKKIQEYTKEIEVEIEDQQNNINKMKETISNLIKINIIEFNKETKNEREEVDRIKNEYEIFINKIIKP